MRRRIGDIFYQRARDSEIRLARRVINGERQLPATNALWYFRPAADCPDIWCDQQNVGKFKAHCFFAPTPEESFWPDQEMKALF